MENGNGEKKWYQRIEYLLGVMGVVSAFFIATYIYIICPIQEIKVQLAIVQEQNSQIIKILDKNETEIARWKKDLNETFADIYYKIGVK